jgi:hypothetical protein
LQASRLWNLLRRTARRGVERIGAFLSYEVEVVEWSGANAPFSSRFDADTTSKHIQTKLTLSNFFPNESIYSVLNHVWADVSVGECLFADGIKKYHASTKHYDAIDATLPNYQNIFHRIHIY